MPMMPLTISKRIDQKWKNGNEQKIWVKKDKVNG